MPSIPAGKDSPVVPLSERTPLVTESVTVKDVASTSDTLIPAIGRFVSSLAVWAPATVLIGASFIGLTVIDTVSVSVSVPPEPVLPRSVVVTVSVSGPL